MLDGRGITIVSGMFGSAGEDYTSLETIRKTGGYIPDQHWDANWATAQAVAKTAKGMDLTLVSSHAGFHPSDAGERGFAKLVDRIGKRRDALRRPRPDAGVRDRPGNRRHARPVPGRDGSQKGATNLGVNFDPANMILYDKGDPIVSLRKLMPRVKQVHIKDAVRTKTPGTWGTEVPIGEGQVDWKAFMQVLAEGNFAGNLVVEREAGQDRAGDVRKAIERLGKLM